MKLELDLVTRTALTRKGTLLPVVMETPARSPAEEMSHDARPRQRLCTSAMKVCEGMIELGCIAERVAVEPAKKRSDVELQIEAGRE